MGPIMAEKVFERRNHTGNPIAQRRFAPPIERAPMCVDYLLDTSKAHRNLRDLQPLQKSHEKS